MDRVRREIRLRGIVQGVGFRPWAARRASALGLAGSVRNTTGVVVVALEGSPAAVDAWIEALRGEGPEGAHIESLIDEAAPTRGEQDFRIDPSASDEAGPRGRIPPDVALCAPCLDDLFDPAGRRHRYPFTHCAVCGPRASVLLDLPWDRERTALRSFPPCGACRAEYADPSNRRFHAQAIACPDCGPRVSACSPDGTPVAGDPIESAAACLRAGGIVAVKGYGGFHLAADATSAEAVALLRKRKGRPAKPFAILVPDLYLARTVARIDLIEEQLLAGPVRAVVIAPRDEAGFRRLGIAGDVSPRTGDVGLLLPFAPLHFLLLYGPGTRPGTDAARFPALVFTSANLTDEPTVHANDDARARLAGIADLLLTHDRDVARPSDDPVFRSAPSGPIPLRLSRATSPLALSLPASWRDAPPVLAVGGDLKCAPAILAGGEILLGEHAGDLACVESVEALERRIADLCRLAGANPVAVAHDLHPGYVGTDLARRLGPEPIGVQHHHAHALACLLEHGRARGLALALDGAGWGTDGTIWGGELLRVDGARFERLARLETVPLPGGDAAVQEPWRMAAVWIDRAFPEGAPGTPWRLRRSESATRVVLQMAARGLRSPLTSSTGRLFDAVASLLDCGDRVTHEGEAAMALESLAATFAGEPVDGGDAMAAAVGGDVVIRAADLIRAILLERLRGDELSAIAWRFHARLASRLAACAAAWARRLDENAVALTGGCLQNRLLSEMLRTRLLAAGIEPLLHHRIPPNDGGLAVGQAAVAAALLLARGEGTRA